MTRPTKRSDSTVHQFRKRVPSDIAAKGPIRLTITLPAVGSQPEKSVPVLATDVVKLSLHTKDPEVAKARAGAVEQQLQRYWAALRAGPVSLSQKQIVSLGGLLYHAFSEALEENPGSVERWQRVIEMNAAALKGEYGTAALMIGTAEDKATAALEQRLGAMIDAVLSKQGVVPDKLSRAKLLREAARQLNAAANKLKRNAEGDYSPDQHASSIPAWSPNKAVTATPSRSILGVFKEWETVAVPSKKISPVTVAGYRSAFTRFQKFLGHDDLGRVADVDVVRFAEKRLADGVSPVTINDGDICALRSVLGWAKTTKRIAENPAASFKLPVGKKVIYRERGFSDAEALAILRACLSYKPSPNEQPHTVAAKRWVPWLCAFSGARVGEMVQLRKQDINKHPDGYWQMVITPAAGSVKTGTFRAVPLHPQLIELGFIKFVEAAPAGPLFLSGRSRGGIKRGGISNRLQQFVRGIVPDTNVQPNHGWRHRFITQARKHGIDSESRRMITGHSGKSVDETHYGDPAGLYEQICRLPAYTINGGQT